MGMSLHVGLNAIDPGHYGTEGRLSGAENDARAMERLARSRGFETRMMLTAEATSDRILDAIRSAAERLASGDTFLFTIAGHGSQVSDEGGDEDDGRDETWCVYDRMLFDDEVAAEWRTFRPGVVIVVVADTCHSQTSARMVRGGSAPVPVARHLPDRLAERAYEDHRALYRARRGASVAVAERPDLDVTLITLSACRDRQTAADGVANGLFTESLLSVWDDGRFEGDYQALVSDVRAAMPDPDAQTPGYEVAGPSSWALARPAFALPDARPSSTPGGTEGGAEVISHHNEGGTMQTLVQNGNWEEVAAELSQKLARERGAGDFMSTVISVNAQAAQALHSGRVAPAPSTGLTRGGSVFRAFWWGFHVELSHEDLDAGLRAADPNGAFVRDLRVVIPDEYEYWIDVIAPFVVAGSTLLRTLDRGRGVYISMSWFAPGIFVPTTV